MNKKIALNIIEFLNKNKKAKLQWSYI